MLTASPDVPNRLLYAVLPPGFFFRLAPEILALSRAF